jgi:phosphoenolpyruvate-protein phosphotransferase (PTS system enzyme I)
VNAVQGIAASRGIAIGPSFRLRRADLRFVRAVVKDRRAEKARFDEATQVALAQLAEVKAKAEAESGSEEAAIFEAHALMLEDPELLASVHASIEAEGLNAEAALHDAAEKYAGMLEALEDEYLSARSADVRDVASRVLRVLLGAAESATAGLAQPSVILARDLTPSDTVMLDKRFVLGFCTAEGGPTAHTAILARSLGLPAVVGAGAAILDIADGTPLAMDGGDGTVLVSPKDDVVAEWRKRQAQAAQAAGRARQRAMEPAITRDGHRVEVVANIGSPADAASAREAGAEGVGLFRSEFLYLERATLPSEDEQYEAYRAVVDVFGPMPVVVRSLDVGGDKELPYLEMAREENPFLGLRGLRLCLAKPELFRPQLRALLRAGVDRNLKVMFPMVSTVAEVRQARAMFDECRTALRAEGKPVAATIEIGIMVEVPAAAIMADHLATEVDFFSIGTNDLSQYTFAADRTNARVSGLANAFQPAVLRLIRDVVSAAHARGKWVGLCGELAGEPLAIPILLGLGLDEFSMNAPAIALAKEVLRNLTRDEAREIAREALALPTPEAIQELVELRVTAARIA